METIQQACIFNPAAGMRVILLTLPQGCPVNGVVKFLVAVADQDQTKVVLQTLVIIPLSYN